jgi:hypothetical protein
LKDEPDEIEVIRNPSDFKAVEQYYHEFGDVSDDQIMQITNTHLCPSFYHQDDIHQENEQVVSSALHVPYVMQLSG